MVILLTSIFASTILTPVYANFGVCTFNLDTFSGDAPLTITFSNVHITAGGEHYDTGTVKFWLSFNDEWTEYYTATIDGPIAVAPDKSMTLTEPGQYKIKFRCEPSSGETVDSYTATVSVNESSDTTPSPTPHEESFDFSIRTSDAYLTVAPGRSTETRVTLTLESGNAEPITLTVGIKQSELLKAVKVSLTKITDSPTFSSELTIITSQDTPKGTFTITVLAEGGGLTRSTTLTLVIVEDKPSPYPAPSPQPTQEADYSLSVSPTSLVEVMEGESASWTIKINWHTTSPERVYLDVKTDPLLMPWHKITLQPREIQAVKEGTADLTIQTKPSPIKSLVHEVEEYAILITAKAVYSGVLRSITVTSVVQEAESIEVLVEPQELYLDYGDKSILNEPNPQAKITVIAKKGGKPAKEMEINIKVCTERGGEGTDGHIHDKGRKRCDRDSRPTGELDNNDGEKGNDLVEKTNENGKIILTYTPPKIHDGNHDHIIAGKDWIIATEQGDPSVEGENWIVTKVPNLQPMPGSELERLCGGEHVPLDSPWFFEKQTRHDCIFYGMEATNDVLVRIANEFMQRQIDCAFNLHLILAVMHAKLKEVLLLA